MKDRRWTIRSGTALLLGAMFFISAVVYGKVAWTGWQEYREGEAANAAGNPKEATVHWERALQLYIPWGGASERSAGELLKQGERLAREGNPSGALEAYQMVRSGLYGARSFYTPHREWIALCDERIARLRASLPPETDKERELSGEQRYREALAELTPPSRPHLIGSIATILGLAGWIGGALGWIWKGLDRRPGAGRRTLLWGGITLVFYLCWLIGMSRA